VSGGTVRKEPTLRHVDGVVEPAESIE